MYSVRKIADNAAVVVPEENLDMHEVPLLEDAFKMTMENLTECNILVDLSKVGYMGSACLRVMVTVDYALKQKGLRMVLFEPNLIIMKLLELTEIKNHIFVRETLEQALNSIE